MDIDKYLAERLIDHYGFSFKYAESILNQSNYDLIIDCIVVAYNKGKEDGTPNYNYSGGL